MAFKQDVEIKAVNANHARVKALKGQGELTGSNYSSNDPVVFYVQAIEEVTPEVEQRENPSEGD